MKGLLCPLCRIPSDNIKGIKECEAAESELVSSAMKFFGIRPGRNDINGAKKTLALMVIDF
jgi:hypothetical protein